MGTLVVRHYPTKLFLKAADHTYVECGTGAKGWKCWGGKAGGKFLRSATGSTLRANSVAKPNEKAGIKCYLVNGVCHQAANRILDQSNITVDGARGYSLSMSLYGVLGREKVIPGLCKAPFDKYPGVNGDLPACVGSTVRPTSEDMGINFNPGLRDFEDVHYMSAVHDLYNVHAEDLQSLDAQFENQMQHFKLFVEHKLGFPLEQGYTLDIERLFAARERFESQRLEAEQVLSATRDGRAFVETIDELTLKFQDDVAESMDGQSYFNLLNLPPDERIILSDPDSVEEAYGPAGAAT